MTVKELDKRINELEDEIWELEAQADEEHFCTDCEHIYISQDIEEYWGARCVRETAVCDADFCPRYSDCPRNAEYEALRDKLEELNAECEKLYALYEMTTEEKGA